MNYDFEPNSPIEALIHEVLKEKAAHKDFTPDEAKDEVIRIMKVAFPEVDTSDEEDFMRTSCIAVDNSHTWVKENSGGVLKLIVFLLALAHNPYEHEFTVTIDLSEFDWIEAEKGELTLKIIERENSKYEN